MTTNDQTLAAAESAAAEAKRAAFFEKVPEPPENNLVSAAATAAEADDAEETPSGPKAAAAKQTTKSTTATQPAATSTASVADQVVAALKAGDLDLLADLTDQDPAAFDEKSTKWAARNRKDAKIKDEMAKVKADAAAVVEHYEPLDTRVAQFHATKNYAVVKEIVELLTGEAWESVSAKTSRSLAAHDPRVPELTRALAERDAELTDLRSAKEKAADRALVEALRDDLPEDHQVRKIKGWEEKTAAVLRESVDDTGEPALSFKQAAQRVVRKAKEQYDSYAEVFESAPTAAARKARAATPERAGGSEPATKRKMTRDEFFAAFAAKS